MLLVLAANLIGLLITMDWYEIKDQKAKAMD